MGVSLCYTTRQDVVFDTRSAIEADAEQLLQTWSPWCEPIGFIDGQGPMEGCTKLFAMLSRHAHGARVPISDKDDLMMAVLDLELIVCWLHRVAHKHDLVWDLAIEDAELGAVDRLGPDVGVCDAMAAMLRDSGVADLAEARRQAPTIRHAYGYDG